MTEKIRKRYEERLDLYQAAIALEVPDRIPISSGSNYLPEIYAGNNKQELIYKPVGVIVLDGFFE